MVSQLCESNGQIVCPFCWCNGQMVGQLCESNGQMFCAFCAFNGQMICLFCGFNGQMNLFHASNGQMVRPFYTLESQMVCSLHLTAQSLHSNVVHAYDRHTQEIAWVKRVKNSTRNACIEFSASKTYIFTKDYKIVLYFMEECALLDRLYLRPWSFS